MRKRIEQDTDGGMAACPVIADRAGCPPLHDEESSSGLMTKVCTLAKQRYILRRRYCKSANRSTAEPLVKEFAEYRE